MLLFEQLLRWLNIYDTRELHRLITLIMHYPVALLITKGLLALAKTWYSESGTASCSRSGSLSEWPPGKDFNAGKAAIP